MYKIKKKKLKILITAGPVWVPIDDVRVITNIFGGALGYIIADEAVGRGAQVKLLMGPGRTKFSGKEKFSVVNFKYYDDIYNLMKSEIIKGSYDIVIHSAAIPDYIPVKAHNGKIKSGKKELVIKFKTTKKIIDEVKKWDKNVLLVKFKLEVGLKKNKLIDLAFTAMKKSKADLIVANELSETKDDHLAYIIDNGKKVVDCKGKKAIANKLLDEIWKMKK